MGISASCSDSEFVRVRVEQSSSSAHLAVNRAGEWSWTYNVRERTEQAAEAMHALLEWKMQLKVSKDPHFALVPPDRLKRHFARYNRQVDSQGQVIVVGPARHQLTVR